MAERMDAELVKSLVDRCLRRLGEQVERFGGTVDKYIGDNVMAIFGAPVAHEDDAERAVRAALAMQGAIAEIDPELQLRVGINTGEVLAGSVAEGGYTVIGDTVNVAARLQAAAEIGTITVGERTVRATRGAVEYRELEPLRLKGKSEPGRPGRPPGSPPPRRAAQRRPQRRSSAARTSSSCSTRSTRACSARGARIS